MKIGIIIHSQTGHTLEVGQKILERLEKDGHQVKLMRISSEINSRSKAIPNTMRIDNEINISEFDSIIFGAWVEGFNLCPGMNQFINQFDKIDTPEIYCFLTQHFPYKWMGGNNAMNSFEKLLLFKSEKVVKLGIINWSNKKRNDQIENLLLQTTDIISNK